MSKADQLGGGASFGQARPVSARRAAIGAATGAPTAGVPDPTELPVTSISQNPDNPREELRDLDWLTQSIKELGVINAITVATVDAYLHERPDRAEDLDEGAKYIVVDGHRRLEGARRAGLKTINVQVHNDRVATDEALLEAAFVANFHRDDMTDLEQAHALESLVKFYGGQTKASQRLGIAQATISSKLSLLKLTPELQADLARGERQVEHVRNLGKLSPDEQRKAADARRVEAQQRSERQRTVQEPPAAAVPPDERPAGDYHAVISEDAAPAANESKAAEPSVAPRSTKADGGGSGSSPTAPARSTAAAEPSPSAEEHLPWDSPAAVAGILRRNMSSENLATLTKLLNDPA